MTVLHGDCREQLATLEDGSVDAIVTDPPYELGFMGKRWDASGIAYDATVWAECYRVLKPGGHVLAFGGTRTYHRMACAIEDVGFEIRDSIHWLYGSGFPKSLNLDGEREGWGTALKPAHEPIVVARKPLIGTVAANVMAHGTGALNIDGTRIGTTDGQPAWTYPNGAGGSRFKFDPVPNRPDAVAAPPGGRWPANLALTHSPDCADDCVAGCPVAALNEQSGNRQSSPFPTRQRIGNNSSTFGTGTSTVNNAYTGGGYSDSGGASRFFGTSEWDPIADATPFRYVAKPSRRERNAGLEGMPEGPTSAAVRMKVVTRADWSDPDAKRYEPKTVAANHHPTVKPVALMRWLVRLVTPPGGTVLDPFLGSGTTAVAAILEGFEWIGCELTDDYLPIIHARTEWAEQNRPQPDLTLFGEPE
jgi:hypothetical protein